jgi:hypothetical protein
MITLSNGYPYYVHLFALHAVRAALDDPPEGHWLSRKRRHVAEIHLETGLRRAVEDDGLSLSTKYNDAVTSTGKRQARKLALEALARTADVEVDLRTIRQSFLDAHPNDDPRFLGSALRELAERHHLLVRRTRMGSTTQLYRFRDPLMKGYVRTRERLNHT